MSKKLNEDTKVFSILGYSRREIFQKFWPYVFCAFGTLCIISVSYTHLDVYKRQIYGVFRQFGNI